jgi:hypothetical protein
VEEFEFLFCWVPKGCRIPGSSERLEMLGTLEGPDCGWLWNDREGDTSRLTIFAMMIFE